jgi:hypothetical protein
MYGKMNMQHLKALIRAPQGTLAFRFYLPIEYRAILYNKAFDGFAANKRRIAEILSAADMKLEHEDYFSKKLEEKADPVTSDDIASKSASQRHHRR